MLEVTEFRGDAVEASDFAIACWRASYAGSAFYPLWDRDYMHRHLFNVPDTGAVCRMGAYQDGKLVGFLAAEAMRFRTPAGDAKGTMSSWLSVAPDQGRRGIAGALRQAIWAWQRDQGCSFMIGFVDTGSVHGKGRAFWTRQVAGASVHRKPLLWAHVLAGDTAAAAEPSRIQGLGIALMAKIQRRARASRRFAVRDYVEADFARARVIFDRLQGHADFGYLWNDARLRHQLGPGATMRTLVLDQGKGTEALANFSALTLMGRFPLRCLVMDFAGATTEAEWLLPEFVRACLNRLHADDAGDAVLALGPPVHDGVMLLKSGLLPLPPAQAMIYLPVASGARMPSVSRLLVHWR